MKKLLIIGGSPRPNGVSEELIRQVKPYFIDCKIVEYNTYKLAPAPCTDCRFCEQHAGCANKDLDIFFEDFEDADYIAFFMLLRRAVLLRQAVLLRRVVLLR